MNKSAEAYPECFKKQRNGDHVQIHLLCDNKDINVSDIPLNFDELERIMRDLYKTAVFKSNGWSRDPEDDRVSADMHKLPEVQKLLDYARTATHAIKWLKKEAIDCGCAQHSPKTGKFEFIGEEKNEE